LCQIHIDKLALYKKGPKKMHKFNNSYYNFGIWISTSSSRVIVVSKSKTSFWLATSLLTVITILEFEFAQVH
jgi:hypothetical protein